MALSCSKKTICIIKRNNSKHHSNFYCLNCLHSFATEKKLESHKKVCENKDFCHVDTKILELNPYQKFDKVPFMQILNV